MVRRVSPVAVGLLLAASFGLALAAAPKPPVERNLLLNGEIATGAGESPDHWRTESWDQKPEVTTYAWVHRAGAPGELEVNNLKPNDARWMQNLSLERGWYHFSAEVRTEAVGTNATGASLSIMEDGIMSSDPRGTNAWRQLDFYLKVGERGADVEVACRLGGYGSLNNGRAFFRNVKAVAIAAPPPGGAQQFDLDAIRRQSAEAPIGSAWSVAATFALLAAIAALGWFTFAAPIPKAADDSAAQRERPRRSARR